MKIITVLLMLCMYSCTIQQPQVKGINNVNTAGLLSTAPSISFDVVLHNPNNMGLTLSNLSVKLKQGSADIATISTSQPQNIGALSDASIPLTFTPTSEEFSKLIHGFDFSNFNLSQFKGTGTLTVRKFFFSKTYKFDF